VIEGEPSNVAGLIGFAIVRSARQNTSQISRGNPVLFFLGEKMIGDAQQSLNDDFQAGFLASLAHGACFKRLQVIQFATHDTPTPGLGRPRAEREQYIPAPID